MSEQKQNAPKLRFPGFTDPWEQRKFSDVFAGLSNNSLSRADLNIEDGLIQSIHYGDILIKYDECLNAEHEQIPYVSDNEIAQKLGSNCLEKGDVIIADAAEDKTVGKCTELVKLGTNPIVSGLHTIPVRPRFGFAPGYLGYYLNTNAFHDQLLPLMQGTKISSVSKTALDTTTICFPSVTEQSEIVCLFEKLSNLITLHQRKLDHLKLQKRGLLQKMFPRDGSDRPDVRFPGFTDAWEQRKLGEVGSVAMNRRIFKEQTTPFGDIPFYKIGTFGGEPDAFISREIFDEYKKNYPFPEIGDILISASGSIGRTVEYTGEEAYFQDSNIVWLKHDGRLDNAFLKCFYSIVKWSGLEGSTIKRLYNKSILDTTINMTCLEEQTLIGSFFRDLDDLITLHQRKLDHLKLQKKALLQQMFI